MRKFSVRWWVTPDLTQWRVMSAQGDYAAPFFTFPYCPVPWHPGGMYGDYCLNWQRQNSKFDVTFADMDAAYNRAMFGRVAE